MVNTAEEFMDSIAANRQGEIDKRISAMNARECKEQTERDRIKQTNATLDKWIDVIKSKEKVKQKQHEAEQQANKDAEMCRRTK